MRPSDAFWLSVIDEMVDQTGIEMSGEQRETATSILQSAASVQGEYSSHSEPSREPVAVQRQPERKQAWWEDVSKLSGSDWVLARQIHRMIASRHA